MHKHFMRSTFKRPYNPFTANSNCSVYRESSLRFDVPQLTAEIGTRHKFNPINWDTSAIALRCA